MARSRGIRGLGLQNMFANLHLIDKGMLSPFRVFYVDPANGSDQRGGISIDDPLLTLSEAHSRCTAGMNDIVCLIDNGSTTGTARITSTLTWSKNATHLIGIGAPSLNNRARIASQSGTTAFAAFIVVTAQGCMFKNLSLFNDYAIAAQITWDDQGGRNYYEDMLFGGMGDATSAASTTSRVIRLGGASAAGENIFRRCTFGIDTIQRSVANATLEFSGGSIRNRFEDCNFDLSASATTALHIISSGVNPLDRFQMFKRCIFHNPYPHATALLQAAVATLAAAGNGRLIMDYCTRYGATKWGTDATSLAQIYENPANGIGVVAT